MIVGDEDLPQDRSCADVVCLTHLRWNWVFQRPQHLMTRAARARRVFVVEEPVRSGSEAALEITTPAANVWVVVPRIPEHIQGDALQEAQRTLVDLLLRQQGISEYTLWYYTPMALPFTRHLSPVSAIYDCMDQLSAFAGAPLGLSTLEAELLARCDLVLTGGHSLYEAKRDAHHNVHAFPSAVDVHHFAAARTCPVQPEDQRGIAAPRIGYYGVIDERLDLALIDGLARARPDWQIVLVGPVIKVDATILPRARNIHYLGAKRYEDLPTYVAGWDVAMMPFARNEATRFISPTKTPEYLAAGKPVVSTSIRDVVRSYGECGLVRIADTVDTFVSAVELSMQDNSAARIMRIDEHLKDQSWDKTWSRIEALMAETTARAALR
ncbi:glycosyltransferase family 1 protein [Nitrospira sp. Nam74]